MLKLADNRSHGLEGHKRSEEEIPNLFEVSHFHAMVRSWQQEPNTRGYVYGMLHSL
jgi:hypothetical protein